MEDFSWKNILTTSGVVIGGGAVSLLFSGLLPVVVMPLKIFLFFTALAAGIFAISYVAGGAVNKIYQNNRENKSSQNVLDTQDDLHYEFELEEDVQAEQVVNREIDVQPSKEEALLRRVNSRASEQPKTELDNMFDALSEDTNKMKQNGKVVQEVGTDQVVVEAPAMEEDETDDNMFL